MAKQVIVYSQPGLMFCSKVKEFLSQNKIEFIERDVASDETALDELQKLGFMTTPVTVVDEAVVVGYDRDKLQKLLNVGHHLS